MRLSIEITSEQHQWLKAVASLQGKSIKDYVLERVLPQSWAVSEQQALHELEAFLAPRIAEADAEKHSQLSVTQIFESVHQSMR